MPPIPQKKQSGFSLIELVTVLLIITVLSTIAIRSTVDIGYSARYEQTRDRLESIKKAIVGDSKRSINGQPDVFGFAADMGRLPLTIKELFEIPNDCDGSTKDGNGDTDNSNDICPYDTSGSIHVGWNGPYLSTSNSASSEVAYSDGWGASSANDYGWIINSGTAPVIGDNNITIESYGKSGEDDTGANSDYYDDDQVITINQSEWKIDITGGIKLTTTTDFNGSCPDDETYTIKDDCNNYTATGWVENENCLKMTVFYREDGFEKSIESTSPPSDGIPRDGQFHSYTFTGFSSTSIPTGNIYIKVESYLATGSPLSCSPAGTYAEYLHSGTKILLVAGHSVSVVHW